MRPLTIDDAVTSGRGSDRGLARELVEGLEEAARVGCPEKQAAAADAIARCVAERGSNVSYHLRDDGATDALTRMMSSATRKLPSDGRPSQWDVTLECASLALSALASDGLPVGTARIRRDLNIGGIRVSLYELSADALGSKVWTSSLYICIYLQRTRSLAMTTRSPACEANGSCVRRRDLLEIGSGVGLLGLFAYQCGDFRSVVLTDNDDELLENLQSNAELNVRSESLSPSRIEVRRLDWALESSKKRQHQSENPTQGHAGEGTVDAMTSEHEQVGVVPALAEDSRFDVVVGADVIYDAEHPKMVAETLSNRLRPSGMSMVAVAVREMQLKTEFLRQLQACGLRVVKQVDPVRAVGIDEDSVLAACGVDWTDGHQKTMLRQSSYQGGIIVFHIERGNDEVGSGVGDLRNL